MVVVAWSVYDRDARRDIRRKSRVGSYVWCGTLSHVSLGLKGD